MLSNKPKIFFLLFLILASARLSADDTEYSDEIENRTRNGFFGISDRPSPVQQSQRDQNQQSYLNGNNPNSMMNFLVPMQPQPGGQQPVVVDENFIYENASDDYLLYGIQE